MAFRQRTAGDRKISSWGQLEGLPWERRNDHPATCIGFIHFTTDFKHLSNI